MFRTRGKDEVLWSFSIRLRIMDEDLGFELILILDDGDSFETLAMKLGR